MLTPFRLFDAFYDRSPSIYVVSDSQLAEYKRDKAKEQVIELDKLIDSHHEAVARLKATRDGLLKNYPAVAEAATDK
jgi:hypothetical protein